MTKMSKDFRRKLAGMSRLLVDGSANNKSHANIDSEAFYESSAMFVSEEAWKRNSCSASLFNVCITN